MDVEASTARCVRTEGFMCDLHADGREQIVAIAEGRLDAEAATALGETVLRVAGPSCELVVLDLREVESVEPEALGVVVELRRRIRRGGGEFVVTPGAALRAALGRQVDLLLESA